MPPATTQITLALANIVLSSSSVGLRVRNSDQLRSVGRFKIGLAGRTRRPAWCYEIADSIISLNSFDTGAVCR